MYFPAGSRCTWSGEWGTVGWFNSPVTQVSEVTSYLEANSHMLIESSSVTEPSVFSTASDRSVTLKIRTLIDRNSIDDIDSDIRAAWYKTISQYPDASSIPDYTLAPAPGAPAAQAQPTGAPSAVPQAGTPANSGNNNPDDNPDWWSKVKDQLQGGSIGLIVGGLAVGALVLVVAVHSATEV